MKENHSPLEWEQEIIWITNKTKSKSLHVYILKMAIAETTHEIWLARNNSIFNGKHEDGSILDKVKYTIKTRCSRQKVK